MKYQWKIELCGYTACVVSLAACLSARSSYSLRIRHDVVTWHWLTILLRRAKLD